ncbi:MAG: ParB N-terminal domain-containing protein, partial [Sciscionella sp.]
MSELYPHPDNPRLRIRDDVVTQIAKEITRDGFGREHALLVRPKGEGRFEILSGHHRHQAAKSCGLAAVPCWVRDVDDDEAFMQLVLSNTQGELVPLEIGIHALHAVPRGRGGRGLTGGIAEYAERLGLTSQYIGQLRNAAEVLSQTRNSGFEFDWLDKAKHLYEISKAPRPCRSVLVYHLARAGWTVEQTAAHVAKVKALASALDRKDVEDWLPLTEVVRHHLVTHEFSPRTVERLLTVAEETLGWIERNATPREAHEFRRWLVANAGGQAWQPRELNAYLQRLIAGQYVVKGWLHGNWRDHVAELDDSSVALLLTDPPYGQGFRSDYRLDRATEHRHERIAGDDDTALDEFAEMLKELRGKLTPDAHLLVFCGWRSEPEFRNVIADAGFTVRGSIVWDKQATGMGDPETTFAPAHERI